MILDLCKRNNIPLQISMGGGYSSDLKDIIEAHSNTFRLAQEIFFSGQILVNLLNSKSQRRFLVL